MIITYTPEQLQKVNELTREIEATPYWRIGKLLLITIKLKRVKNYL